MDDLDARGPIYTGGIRLRALWTVWSVVVRVHSSAWKSPVNRSPVSAGNPLSARVIYPALEVFRHEPQRPLPTSDADRGDAARLRGFVEPCARDAELRRDLGGLEQSSLFASHTATDRQHAEPATQFRKVYGALVHETRDGALPLNSRCPRGRPQTPKLAPTSSVA